MIVKKLIFLLALHDIVYEIIKRNVRITLQQQQRFFFIKELRLHHIVNDDALQPPVKLGGHH